MSKSRLSKTSAIVAHAPSQVALDVEKARTLLAASKSIEHAKSIRDAGKGIEHLLRAQRAGSDAVNEAIEVQLWASRRVGELLRELPKATGAEHGGKRAKDGSRKEPSKKTPTLADQGLDKKTAHRCQKLAEQPERQFAEVINTIRARGEKLTATGVLTSSSAQPGYDGDESYTPSEYVEAARFVLGAIDLDPFSCAIAQETVRAKRFYTSADDGLLKPWTGRAWFQPPYSQPLMDQAVMKLMLALDRKDRAHDLSACVALTNAATDTQWWQGMADRALLVCLVRKRINFEQPNPRPTEKHPGPTKPTKGNRYSQSFMVFGDGVHADRFRSTFGKFGVVGPLRFVREVAT